MNARPQIPEHEYLDRAARVGFESVLEGLQEDPWQSEAALGEQRFEVFADDPAQGRAQQEPGSQTAEFHRVARIAHHPSVLDPGGPVAIDELDEVEAAQASRILPDHMAVQNMADHPQTLGAPSFRLRKQSDQGGQPADRDHAWTVGEASWDRCDGACVAIGAARTPGSAGRQPDRL